MTRHSAKRQIRLEDDRDYLVFAMMGEFNLRFEVASRLMRKHTGDTPSLRREAPRSPACPAERRNGLEPSDPLCEPVR